MEGYKTERGFRGFEHTTYGLTPDTIKRIVQESSGVGDYDDALDNPGSSFLWIGDDFHLNREQVKELIDVMTMWYEQGRLPTPAQLENLK